jgi:ZIP family zinc transporter
MAFFSRKFNPSFLCGALGFSAGVMIYVSMVEIFFKAKESLGLALGDKPGYWATVGAFFGGIALIALIDKLVPSFENPHEIHNIDCEKFEVCREHKLLRMGLFSALAIGIHNFPEGLATFMAGLSDPALGLSIAVAIAIHNIPEGIAVSVPIYYATKSRRKALWLSLLSGLSEPVGAIAGYFILRAFFNDVMFGVVFAVSPASWLYLARRTAPTAEEYGKLHVVIGGVISGMVVMALSLLLLS